MSTLADYRDAAEALVPGATGMLSADKSELDAAIQAAVRQHSSQFPAKVVQDLSGAGSFAFACSGLARWEDDFSFITLVEYPVDDDSRDKNYLDASDWRMYETPTGKQLQLLEDTPATGEFVRVTYAAMHTITDAACTIPSAHEQAVFSLVASHVCRVLAAQNAQNAAPSIGVDTADTKSMRQEYEAQAAKYYQQYCRLMGVQPDKPKIASVTMDWDVDYPGGYDRLTHPHRYR